MGLRPVAGTAPTVYAELVDWVEHGGEPIVVQTSGSTGEPKRVRLSHRAVLASAHASLDRLGGPGQWISALPATSVGGLQVLVRSIVAGFEPVFAKPDVDGVRAAVGRLAATSHPPRSYASLVPTQLFRLIESGHAADLAPLDAVLLGGAAAPAGLLERARAAGVTIVRTYGMSETAGGCVYDGRPLTGVRMRIGDGSVVELAGEVLFDGYGDEHFSQEWFRTGDLGELGDDGLLRILGRADDVVVSGGVNVPLAAVEALVRSVPAVVEAAAVAVDDAEWGQRIVAFVVIEDERAGHGLRAEVSRLAGEQERPRAEIPRQIRVLPELPLLPGGKVDRVTLRQLAVLATPGS